MPTLEAQSKLLVRIARSMAPNRLADDVAQEALIAVWRCNVASPNLRLVVRCKLADAARREVALRIVGDLWSADDPQSREPSPDFLASFAEQASRLSDAQWQRLLTDDSGAGRVNRSRAAKLFREAV